MSKSKMYEEVLLGNAFDTILNSTQHIPTISEYQFTQHPLYLLRNPFDHGNLEQYLPYVGDLMRPLNVVDNQDRNRVLFTVPPLFVSPKTTVPRTNGMNADQMFVSLKREMELGGRGAPEKIAGFMRAITQAPDVQAVLIRPLREILHRYGMDFDVPGVHVAEAQPNGQLAQPHSSFGDGEYED